MRALVSLAAGAALCGASLVACFIDPVHDQQVKALGPEAPGVSPGPLHRPGQPCLVCHGGEGPAKAHFSVAGTIFAIQGETTPMPTALVDVTDSTDAGVQVETNAAGNFYFTPQLFNPKWPGTAAVSYGTNVATMIAHIGRNGSCADCHFNPPGADSPGPVYLYFDQASVPDGGIP